MLSPINGFPVLPKMRNSASAHGHESFGSFIQRQALKRNAKTLADMLDVTTRTVGKMRAGDANTSGPVITKWCQRDPEFRAAYFSHCGGHIEARPALVKGLSEAISAVLAANAVEVFGE